MGGWGDGTSVAGEEVGQRLFHSEAGGAFEFRLCVSCAS